MSLLTLTIASLTVTTLLYTINTLVVMKPDINKLSPYECGFDPLEGSRTPVSIQFFLVAILFILFDLEIILLLPVPWSLNTHHPGTTATLATMLLIVLALGLVYEWLQGGLEWTE
uniref:NADH-ubiquinone oxidoreductase chain 3 n=1 Tax=Pareas stanleyi TaxID=1197907 RepID=A0A898NQG4_9SAUR|nr:NADH dehydrogenase subunit 3 [Pareas stanleyi]QSJ54559.1 NADH dehydrogenase subunit 3 [Pareas stanleyi]